MEGNDGAELSQPGTRVSTLGAIQGQYLRALARMRGSRFARDSVTLFVLNLLSRGVSFFASAFALRCLGPYNIGISALIQTTAQQVALVYNGGFDMVAVRRIADDRTRVAAVTRGVVRFRGAIALVAAMVWVAVVWFAPGLTHRWVWLLGAPLLLVTAAMINYVFTGMERLPIQTAIATGGTLLTASAYFIFFHAGMPLGSDLVVIVGVGIVTSIGSWIAYRKLVGTWPVGAVQTAHVRGLVTESWRFWVLAIATFLYSTFQLPLIAYFLGATQTGLYRSAFTMAAAIELLYNSVNTLLLPRLVAWKSEGLETMWRRQHRLFALFTGGGLLLTGVLVFAAPLVYRWFLGPAYATAIPIFQILLFGRLVVFVGQIYAYGLAAVGLDNMFLGAAISGAVASTTLNVLLLRHTGLRGAAYVSVASELIVCTICYVAQRRYILRERHAALAVAGPTPV